MGLRSTDDYSTGFGGSDLEFWENLWKRYIENYDGGCFGIFESELPRESGGI